MRPAPKEGWILAGILDGVPAQPALLDELAGIPYVLRIACDLALAGATRIVVVWSGSGFPPSLAAIAADPRLAQRATLEVSRVAPSGNDADGILIARSRSGSVRRPRRSRSSSQQPIDLGEKAIRATSVTITHGRRRPSMRSLVLLVLTLLGCAREDRAIPPVTPAKPAVRVPANAETALLAGGCFWGMEEILRKVPGVVDTAVGYVAGAEAVQVVFDPAIVSYATLLDRWYFRMHDPTTKHRQGNDIGAQYRSAIFYLDDAQRATAEEIKQRVAASGKWKAPIVTEIVAATKFTLGEGYHQDFLQREPDSYTCHYLRD